MTNSTAASADLGLQDAMVVTAQQGKTALKALTIATSAWASVAIIGQLMFAAFVVWVFWLSALTGHIGDWSKALPIGYVPGNNIHNIALILHMIFAVIILLAGALQLLPYVRQHYARLHRWSGRFYMVGVMVAAAAGLVMTWYGKGGPGDVTQHIGITGNAALIFFFAGQAWRDAMQRRFASHRRWALRLFIVSNGVWFYRLALPLWLMINQGPVGFDPGSFTGPFLSILSFASYLLPLALLELYLLVQRQGQAVARFLMAGLLAAASILTVAGTAAASIILWLPGL